MAVRKKKRLPKNFGALLDAGDLDALIAVFDMCELDALDGPGGSTAMGMYGCPEALIRWLAGQGADVDATNRYGNTPLHQHACVGHHSIVEALLQLGANIEARRNSGETPLHQAAAFHKPTTVRVLVGHGADVRALDQMGRTPLQACLTRCRNGDIAEAAEIAELLLAAGTGITDDMRTDVGRIAREFEFHRAGFNPELLPQADAGLARLYALFDVAAVAPRRVHDGTSAIAVSATGWAAQHQELWDLLVPSAGAAPTVQGEVIRITGRVSYEILANGAGNWNADYRKMVDALPAHFGSENPLPERQLAEATRLTAAIRTGHPDDDDLERAAELAVQWVLANPAPVALAAPPYRR